jgi:hypothetical protein
MINVCGAFGGIRIGRGNQSKRKSKAIPVTGREGP